VRSPNRQLAVRHFILSGIWCDGFSFDDKRLGRPDSIRSTEGCRSILDELSLGWDLRAAGGNGDTQGHDNDRYAFHHHKPPPGAESIASRALQSRGND
jgi:hypothetical protein